MPGRERGRGTFVSAVGGTHAAGMVDVVGAEAGVFYFVSFNLEDGCLFGGDLEPSLCFVGR